jgi:hypothetical protein
VIDPEQRWLGIDHRGQLRLYTMRHTYDCPSWFPKADPADHEAHRAAGRIVSYVREGTPEELVRRKACTRCGPR